MQKLSKRLEEMLEDWKTGFRPGIALSVISEEETIFSRTYGFAALEYNMPVSRDTQFYLCSLSKQFTAFCVAELIYEGRLNVQDRLLEHFPELPESVYGEIKVNHLVHMCSGIHEWYDMLEFSGSYNDEYPWRKTLLSLLARQESLNFTPGDKHIYCNTNYTLLTLLIEQTTNKSLAEYAREQIFAPLGMNSTFYNEDNNQIIKNIAMGYYRISDHYKRADMLPPLIGAGGVTSTLADLEIWLKTLINGTWQPEILEMMLAGDIFNNGDANEYLFGFVACDIKGRRVIRHGGAVPGFFTSICFSPSDKAGFVWLANSNDFKPERVNTGIIDILEETLFHKPEANSQAGNDGFGEFSGRYIDISTGNVEILKVTGDWLHLADLELSFLHQRDLNFFTKALKPDALILENYYGLVILRHITASKDRLLVKGDALPETSNLAEYCGKYHSVELNVDYTISANSLKLYIDAVKKYGGASLIKIAKDIFLSPSEGIKLRFQRNDKGNISSFYLDCYRSQNFKFRLINGL
ncbi:MAG: beta-lactamase family protein [Candidatus Cloacimonetes bacterium]|nr:beta-lactamase family protein [Candidatus Cloacimonadota bacterium]